MTLKDQIQKNIRATTTQMLITTSHHEPKIYLHELPRAKTWEKP